MITMPVRLFALVMAVLVLTPAVVSAHVLQENGSISAKLHINPKDNPIAGQVSTLGFSLSDTTKHFKARDCACSLVVERNGAEISRLNIPQTAMVSDGVILLPYTFPQRDVYELHLVGRPQTGAPFKAFELEYIIRVARAEPPSAAAAPSLTAVYVLLGGALSVLVFLCVQAIIRKH